MTPLKVYRSWNLYWFGPISAYPLALFRIFLGIYLLWYFLTYVRVITLVFSRDGIYMPFLIPDIAPSPAVATLIYASTLVCILVFMLGYRTRIFTPLVLVGFFYHYLLNIAVQCTSYDRLIIGVLIILCFAELDRVWSLSARSRPHDNDADPVITAWAQRFICVLVSFIYFGMSIFKIYDFKWCTGYMLETNLNCEWATPLAFWVVNLDFPPVFYTGLSWAAIILEFVLSIGLWIRRFQAYIFFAGFLFHLFIAAFLNIPEFLFLPTSYVLYMDPDRVRRWGDAAWRTLGVKSSA